MPSFAASPDHASATPLSTPVAEEFWKPTGASVTVMLDHRTGFLLTPRQSEILLLICDGLANKDIATRLAVSPKTIESHRRSLYIKLGVSTMADLARQAIRMGIIYP
jgi:DNA-binding NarL/FixJ family response regulator